MQILNLLTVVALPTQAPASSAVAKRPKKANETELTIMPKAEETTKTKLRKDLYERLITMGESHHLTDVEKEQKAITKSRWMELRDAMSSTTTL